MASLGYSAHAVGFVGDALCVLFTIAIGKVKHYMLRIISKNYYMDLVSSSCVLCVWIIYNPTVLPLVFCLKAMYD
jgi:hypothetical protein